jgi:succinate dehydrogenase / fumarate reductase cytochrome b subunit
VSILHRVSGLVLIVLMPFVIWMFDTSVTDEVSFDQFRNAFVGGIGFVPAFVVKLAALALIWGFLQHFCAGVRHLYMDFTHTVDKEFGRVSALVAIGVAVVLTLVFAYKLFIGY